MSAFGLTLTYLAGNILLIAVFVAYHLKLRGSGF